LFTKPSTIFSCRAGCIFNPKGFKERRSDLENWKYCFWWINWKSHSQQKI